MIGHAKCLQGCGEIRLSYTPGGNVKRYNSFEKNVQQFLKKLNIDLPYKPTVPLLDIFPREMKAYVHKKLCTNVQSSSICSSPNCRQFKFL